MKNYSWDGRVLSVTYENTAACSAETVMWNSLDGEHLTFIHSGYKTCEVLFEDGRNSLWRLKTRIPIIRFLSIPTTLYVCVVNANLQVSYASQLGVVSQTLIEVKELGPETAQVRTTYSFQLGFMTRIFRGILATLIYKWNKQVWAEDLPIKLRREWTRNNGFVDFRGFVYGSAAEGLQFPLRRPKDSPIHLSPIRSSTSRRERLKDLSDTLNTEESLWLGR